MTQAAPQRPNFVFLLIDDMGYADLSCYGGEPGLTPNIDSIAKEGIRFSQFYVGGPICSPSRTAFTTGQAPARWRITSFLANRAQNERRGMAQWLDPKAPTLAAVLHKKGYATGHFGKWHMGGQRDVGEAPLITEYGFDESLTQFEGLGDRILPLLDAYDGTPVKKHALGSDNLGRGNIQWMDRSKVTSAFVSRALDFIRRSEKAGKPFYVNLWPDDVHSPFFPPASLRKGESKRDLYLGVTKAMDNQLAPLFQYLRERPALRTNTVLVIASDNGPEPGAGSAGVFRGNKGALYEGGVREPFIIWAPGLLSAKAVGTLNEKTVVSGMDLLPSIAAMASAELPKGVVFDGEDLSRAMLGLATPERSKALCWVRPPDRAERDGVQLPDLAIRKGNWKLLTNRDGSNPELYDLDKDPGETRNVAKDHPDVLEPLRSSLMNWYKTLPAQKDTPAVRLSSAKRARH